MCNEAYRRTQLGEVAQDWGETRVPLVFPEGAPNFPPLDGFRITDRVEIIRRAEGEAFAAAMVTRRWSWPAPGGKGGGGRPVYNFRSDGRRLGDGDGRLPNGGRCLIPVDGFFEFTDPPAPPEGAPRKRPPKSKWAFTMAGRRWFCIAGVWRADPAVGEAWAMLTCPPGPDIAPYHDRQVVVLGPSDWARWLSGEGTTAELCRPAPAGTLEVVQVR